MRILFVAHRLPYPPNSGGKIRAFHTIKHLSKAHDVVVAAPARSRSELEQGTPLKDYCQQLLTAIISRPTAWRRMITNLATPTPSSMGYFYSPELAASIRSAVQTNSFDLVFVHCSSVAQYVLEMQGIPKVLDFVDMDSAKWLMYSQFQKFPLSLGYRIEGTKLQRAEIDLARQFDLCTVTTATELDTLNSYETGTKADWFPNGVDCDYFSPNGRTPKPASISFVGRMDYYPNVECMVKFCHDVLPIIQSKVPDATLTIIGANPTRAAKSLGKLRGVAVTGFLPDVRDSLRQSMVAVAPLNIARGTQNKLLETMAMGIPTVASSTACRGVDAVPGDHLLSADSPDEFSNQIVRVLTDPGLRNRLSEAGRSRMLTHHTWVHAMDKLEKVLESHLPTYAGNRMRRPSDCD